jgi:multiple sugar transport system substrate-binding protein
MHSHSSFQYIIIRLYVTVQIALVLHLLLRLSSARTQFLIVVLLFIIPFIYAGTQESIQGVDDSSLEFKKHNITLTALLEDQGDPTRWKSLIEPAMQ